MNFRSNSRGHAALLGLVFAFAAAAEAPPPLPHYGHLEHVRVIDKNSVEVSTKLDPAAEASTLAAQDLKYFQRDGKTWVRFVVDNGSVLPGNRATLERLVLRDVHVKQRGGGIEHQPRVALELCLGSQQFSTEVLVAPRTDFTAPLELGRDDLAKLGAVDASRQFTQEPACVPTQPTVAPLPPKP